MTTFGSGDANFEFSQVNAWASDAISSEDARQVLAQFGALLPKLGALAGITQDTITTDKLATALSVPEHGQRPDYDITATATNELWPTALEALRVEGSGNPSGNYDQTWVLGARGDTMLEMANKVEIGMARSVLQPGRVVYLAGMRPAEGVFDARAANYLYELGDRSALQTEADLADGIIRMVHGAQLVQEQTRPSPHIVEAPNELGERGYTDRLYVDQQSGREFSLINGAAVRRDRPGLPASMNRHTSRSVVTESLDLLPPLTNSEILLMVQQPHHLRVAFETLKVLDEQQRQDLVLRLFGNMASAERLQPGTVFAELAATYRHATILASTADKIEPAQKVLATIEQGHRLEGLAQTIYTELLSAYALAGPYSNVVKEQGGYQPGLILRSYLSAALGERTQRRGDQKALFAEHPAAQAKVLKILRGLGIENTEDVGLESVKPTKPFIFLSEGGSGFKMNRQLDLLGDKDAPKPAAIILAGADWRTIKPSEEDGRGERNETARILGVTPSEVGATEYDAAIQFAQRIVAREQKKTLPLTYDANGIRRITEGEQGKLVLHGYSEGNVPVFTVQISQSEISKRGPGVQGTIDLMSQLAAQEEFQRLAGTDVSEVCLATATLYAPTRKVAAAAANLAFAQRDSQPFAAHVLTYGRSAKGLASPEAMSHAASEAFALTELVADLIE